MFPVSLLCGGFVVRLLRVVSELSLIIPKTREAENLAAPGKGGEQALCHMWFCMWMKAKLLFTSPQARGRVSYGSFCIELCCPGVNVHDSTSEDGRENQVDKMHLCLQVTCNRLCC